MEARFLKVLNALLDDEHGINEKAWEHINILVLQVFGSSHVPKSVEDLLDKVESTDGRFYLPK